MAEIQEISAISYGIFKCHSNGSSSSSYQMGHLCSEIHIACPKAKCTEAEGSYISFLTLRGKSHLVRELSWVKAPVHRLGSSKNSLRKLVPEKFCHCSTGSKTVSTSKMGLNNLECRVFKWNQGQVTRAVNRFDPGSGWQLSSLSRLMSGNFSPLTSPVGEVLERGALAAADVALDEDGVGPLEAGNVTGWGPFLTEAARAVVSMVLGGAAEKVTREGYASHPLVISVHTGYSGNWRILYAVWDTSFYYWYDISQTSYKILQFPV